jgi:methylphosphotriester-DNA--protein-cysteine methyltransferase
MSRWLLCFLSFLIFSSASFSQFVASKNSNKFHTENCKWAKKISPKNKITFQTYSQAIQAGFQPCHTCSPSSVNDKATENQRQKYQKQNQSQDNGDGQCQAITKKGTRCTRKAVSGSKYCWQHKNYGDKNDK